jgi:hypothetical protein
MASPCMKLRLVNAALLAYNLAHMVETALTIVGYEHRVYYPYPHDNLIDRKTGMCVLGPRPEDGFYTRHLSIAEVLWKLIAVWHAGRR